MKNKALFPMFHLSVLSLSIASVLAQAAETTAPTADSEEVVVTGFRKSLEDATAAKRSSNNFSDSVFAEDIGKFPDLNIAESLNRIPGVQLTRDVNGEGLNIAIRGLGTNFTKVTLNGSQISVASSGSPDSQNQNREVDLDLFPTELFTRLDVNKTPTASMIEGGVSGVVNMRSARPFDNPGTHVNYQLQGAYKDVGSSYSPRGAFTASWTDDQFGVLVGIAGADNHATTQGFETIGWTNPNLSAAQCGQVTAAPCDSIGGNGWSIPWTVPTGVGNGLTAGTTIDAAFLQAKNPGTTLKQIGDGLFPRLGRPSYMDGTRARTAGLLSLEYRPSDSMRFYLDSIYTRADRDFDRLDVNLAVRNSATIPLNEKVDANNVVTSATLANAQFFLEARPYAEDVTFYNINPGAHFEFNDLNTLDVQLNKSQSNFYRESPTILVNTPLGQGITVQYDNTVGAIPSITSNADLNNPNLGWVWAGGRLNIANEKRMTETKGAHVDYRFGDDKNNVHVGVAHDVADRTISNRDNSGRWEDVVCRNGLNASGNSPTTNRAACTGLNANSLISPTALASYLKQGPAGFITVDFDRFKADTGYYALAKSAPESNTAVTGANTGGVNESTDGAFIEANGEADIAGHALRVNAGTRYISTDQVIRGPVTIAGVRQYQELHSTYNAYLPSFNASLDALDDLKLRMSASRTLTRANPSAMLPNTNFSDPSAQQASQGNPKLNPYLSTNFDLGGEWYTGGAGYVGVTLFSKQMNGFTVNGTNTIPFAGLGIPYESLTDLQKTAITSRGGPDAATVTVTQQVNADGLLNLKGQEITWVQPLDNILQGFGFNANYTHVTQQGSGTGAPAQAIGISPVTYNFTGYWENYGASVRLSYTWNDKQVISGPNQNSIPLAQLKADARGQWDLSASYKLADLPTQPQLTLNVINLTSEPLRTTFMHDNATFTYYDPGYSVIVGVRGKF
jgi:TonB-dependent receptor